MNKSLNKLLKNMTYLMRLTTITLKSIYVGLLMAHQKNLTWT